jgi:hypothetical protein
VISLNARILRIILEHVGKEGGNPKIAKQQFYENHLRTHCPEGKKILSYGEFTQAVNYDRWPASPARIKACMDAAFRCAAAANLSKELIDKLLLVPEPADDKYAQLPKALSGAWIMVQYRGKQLKARECPPLDYRIAVLVYGTDDTSNRRYFEIVGEKTFWKGKAWLLDEQIYFWADETERTVKEALSMILFKINTEEDTDHHGINLSVSHGGPRSGQSYPILASRVLMFRSQSLTKELRVEIDGETKKKIRDKWCKYFTEAEFKKMRLTRSRIEKEIYRAIEAFQERQASSENQGDRVFLHS